MYVRVLAVVALLFLSITALYGGTVLIIHAHGNPWGMMPLNLLRDSPFHSWLVPGIILLTANGVLGLWVLGLVLARCRHDGFWAMFQGCVLLGWLVAECVLLRMVIWPHYLYGVVALVLILAGAAMRHSSPSGASAN
ncbi:MAG TPA: hypothetical protein VHE33_01925 [Acidobacteriaceae bacterium]|nr:hypothetical protein [Acidobacteriaceae bacterium]